MFDVPFVRAELERLHAGRHTAIIERDYLDLAIYWADIIDIIGLHNLQGVIPQIFFKISYLLRRHVLDRQWGSFAQRRAAR